MKPGFRISKQTASPGRPQEEFRRPKEGGMKAQGAPRRPQEVQNTLAKCTRKRHWEFGDFLEPPPNKVWLDAGWHSNRRPFAACFHAVAPSPIQIFMWWDGFLVIVDSVRERSFKFEIPHPICPTVEVDDCSTQRKQMVPATVGFFITNSIARKNSRRMPTIFSNNPPIG